MLIDCPECEKRISNNAKMCPDCGYDIEKRNKNTNSLSIILFFISSLAFGSFAKTFLVDWTGIFISREAEYKH